MPLNVFDSVGFHPLIKRWFRQRFANPSPPQQLGWPSIADAHHTLILAPTGSGKTLAAFLWSIDQLLRRSLSLHSPQFSTNLTGIHTLYISPLKALNNYIARSRANRQPNWHWPTTAVLRGKPGIALKNA